MKTALSRPIALILVFSIIFSIFPIDTALAAKTPTKVIEVLKKIVKPTPIIITPPPKLTIPEITYNGKVIPTAPFLATKEGKDILDSFQKERNIIKSDKEKALNEAFKFTLTKKLVERGELPKDYFAINLPKEKTGSTESILNINSSPKFVPKKNAKTRNSEGPKARIQKVEVIKSKARVQAASLLSPSSARDLAISYLISTQNADGSWGNATSTKFQTTIAVLEAFRAAGVVGTSTTKGNEFITYYFADNANYLAKRIVAGISAGEATSTVESILNYRDQTTGGFRIDSGYESDIVTTANVLLALEEAEYKDYGTNPDLTQLAALNYLVNKQKSDKGWSALKNGESSIYVTSEVIASLLPWKQQFTSQLNSAIAYLGGSQLTDGSWNGKILDTAVGYYGLTP